MSSPLRWLVHLTQGIAIGIANVIPGVSGGTMALVFGIYERLITQLSILFKAGLTVLRFDFKAVRASLVDTRWMFLFWLTVGVLVAPLLGAALIPGLLETWPQHSRSLFFGLILGTIPIPWLRISDHRYRNVAVLVIAAAVSFVLVGIPPLETANPSLIAVFASAVLAISAMILPGISGAFILLILGMYTPVFEAISDRNFLVIAVFGAGAAVGLGGFSVFLKWLMSRAHDATMAALVGLMLGSLRSLWPWLSSERSLLAPDLGDDFWVIVGLGLAGLVVSGGVTLWEARKNRPPGVGPVKKP